MRLPLWWRSRSFGAVGTVPLATAAFWFLDPRQMPNIAACSLFPISSDRSDGQPLDVLSFFTGAGGAWPCSRSRRLGSRRVRRARGPITADRLDENTDWLVAREVDVAELSPRDLPAELVGKSDKDALLAGGARRAVRLETPCPWCLPRCSAWRSDDRCSIVIKTLVVNGSSPLRGRWSARPKSLASY